MGRRSIGLGSCVLLIAFASWAFAADETEDAKACKAGDVSKCEALVRHYSGKENPSQVNIPKAFEYLQLACEFNSGAGCNNLGAAWSEGKGGASQIDHAKAASYYEKACHLKHGLGCFNFANVYRLGEGVPKDLGLAFANFKTSCDLNEAKGCTEIAIMYYEGTAVTKDVGMATSLMEKACQLGSKSACTNADLLKKSKEK